MRLINTAVGCNADTCSNDRPLHKEEEDGSPYSHMSRRMTYAEVLGTNGNGDRLPLAVRCCGIK